MKILYRRSAVVDLERIFDWIADDSQRNAVMVTDRILIAIDDVIAVLPYIGRSGDVSGTREWVVRGLPYIVIYEVDEARGVVTILSIVHGAQQR